MIPDRGASLQAAAGVDRALVTPELPLHHTDPPGKRARRLPRNTTKVTATRIGSIESRLEVIETTATPTAGTQSLRGGTKLRAIRIASIRSPPGNTILMSTATTGQKRRRGDIARESAIVVQVAATPAAEVIIGPRSTRNPNRKMALPSQNSGEAPLQVLMP